MLLLPRSSSSAAPRPVDAPLSTRKGFMNALRRELPEALRNLQHGNIAPVDLAQAAIGPGMGVFTRYSKVVESDGNPMTVRTEPENNSPFVQYMSRRLWM